MAHVGRLRSRPPRWPSARARDPAAEKAKWSALLGESGSWRTNVAREVRHKTLHVAQTRIRTALNRLTPKGEDSIDGELVAALEKAGR